MPENGPKPEGTEEVPLPAVVTFTSGAALLVQLKIVTSMTREGIRKISKTDPSWPFGPGRPHPYVPVGNAQAMPTEPFLDFFRERGKLGRGPAKKPADGAE